MIIPINRKINSERMLKTGEFQTEHFHNDEMLWLVTYLRKNKKLDKKQVFAKWVPFYLKNKTTTPEYASDSFETFWKRSKYHTIKNNRDKIIIWQEEIDYINSLPIPVFVKEYFFILLMHTRATKNELYDSIPYLDYHWYLSSNDRHYDNIKSRLLEYAKRYNFINIVQTSEKFDYLPDINDDGFEVAGDTYDTEIINYKLNISSPVCKYGGEIPVIYDDILDGLSDMKNKISNISICTECGAEFEFNNKTQKTICDDCWNKKEKERLRQKNNTIKEFTKICSCCGKEFIANGKTKKNVCDECWKKQRQLKKNEYLKKWKLLKGRQESADQ